MNTQSNDRHAWTQEHLDAYIADGLTPEERTGVDQHVVECPDCREALHTLMEMDQKMQTLFAEARPEADFEQRIIARLWHATWRARLSTLAMKRVRFAIAASLLLASCGLLANSAVENNVLSNPMSGMLADAGHEFMPNWIKESAHQLAPPELDESDIAGVAAAEAKGTIRGEYRAYPGKFDTNYSSDRNSDVQKYSKLTLNNGQRAYEITSTHDKLAPIHDWSGRQVAGGDIREELRGNGDSGIDKGRDHIFTKDDVSKIPTAIVKPPSDVTVEVDGESGKVLTGSGISTSTGLIDRNSPQLTIKGTGTTAFSRANTYAGETTISSGTLQITGREAATDNSNLTIGGTINGSGSLTKSDAQKTFGSLSVSNNNDKMLIGNGGTSDYPNGGYVYNHRENTKEDGRSVNLDYAKDPDSLVAANIETGKTDVPTITVLKDGAALIGQVALEPTSPPPTTQPSPPAVQATATNQNQKIIRTGTMEFEVRSFDDASDTINKVVTEEGGFVAGTNSEKLANGKVKGTITVRVDPARLDRVVLKLRGLGDLKTQQISAQDITKEYTDMESELRANRSMEERMLDIIKNGKGSIKDLVEAEKQLGVYRERIEKTEGEKRYYDNLVGLSTLSITCYEKDIQAAANAAETENVVMSVETEDVEAKFADAKAAIEKDAGGRIIKAELRRFEASQLAAQIICEVPADKADLLVVRFKQLGKVAGLDRVRSQSTPNGQGTPLANAKVEQKNTQVSLSLYNLANLTPRQTAVLTVAVPNVEEAYNAVLHRVRQDAPLPPAADNPADGSAKPVGVIATSNLSGQQPEQMTAEIRADVRTVEAPAVLAAIRGLGEVMSSTITENPDTSNVTASKQGIQLRLVAVAAIPSRDTQTLQIAATDVPSTYSKLLDAMRPLEGEKGGHILVAQLNQQDVHNVAATLDVELRRTDQGIFDAALAATGAQVVARNVSRSTDAANTLDSKVRYTVTLAAADSLPPRESAAIALEVDDVERALSDLRAAIVTGNGHELDANTSKDAGGHITAHLLVDVPLANSPDLLAKLQALGKERTNENSRNPQAADGKLARARYDITLSNTAGLVPQGKSIGSTLRATVSASLAALLWSLYLIVNGLLVVGPWVLLGWVAWRLLKRKKTST